MKRVCVSIGYCVVLAVFGWSPLFSQNPDPMAKEWDRRQEILNSLKIKIQENSSSVASQESIKGTQKELDNSGARLSVSPLSLMQLTLETPITQREMATILESIPSETQASLSKDLRDAGVLGETLFHLRREDLKKSPSGRWQTTKTFSKAGKSYEILIEQIDDSPTEKNPKAHVRGALEFKDWFEKEELARGHEQLPADPKDDAEFFKRYGGRFAGSGKGPHTDPQLARSVLEFYFSLARQNKAPEDYYAVVFGRMNLLDGNFQDTGELFVQLSDSNWNVTQVAKKNRILTDSSRSNAMGYRYVAYVPREISEAPTFARMKVRVEVNY